MFQSTHPRGVRQDGVQLFRCRRYVSIHAPAWGATSATASRGWSRRSFNPRTRVGCDIHGAEYNPRIISVSIHAPAWGATAVRFRRNLIAVVSIHAPAWGATSPPSQGAPSWAGFNPRTRVGCDSSLSLNTIYLPFCFNPRTRVGCDAQVSGLPFAACWFQSTHPRGVRPWVRRTRLPARGVSIHAPAWGATRRRSVMGDLVLLFQSTHPRGVRHSEQSNNRHQKSVSIHAPAWGATCIRSKIVSSRCWFQSTHPRGVRLAGIWASSYVRVTFQSTHPRGVRPLAAGMEGGRLEVSIHAPAWGATMATYMRGQGVPVSIHAPAWGATPGGVHDAHKVGGVSIHAPAWGATRSRSRPPAGPGVFQSTHPRGVRLSASHNVPTPNCVSIHAPAWGATVSMFYPVDSRD